MALDTSLSCFQVYHNCGWGCKGSFIPSKYNSSRAKCIECSYCNVILSPNKFIFHFHHLSSSTYHHPDAANFNSWRRHLFLDYKNPSEQLNHAWEDVKAMFNGGSRKKSNDYTFLGEPCKEKKTFDAPKMLNDVKNKSSCMPENKPLPIFPYWNEFNNNTNNSLNNPINLQLANNLNPSYVKYQPFFNNPSFLARHPLSYTAALNKMKLLSDVFIWNRFKQMNNTFVDKKQLASIKEKSPASYDNSVCCNSYLCRHDDVNK